MQITNAASDDTAVSKPLPYATGLFFGRVRVTQTGGTIEEISFGFLVTGKETKKRPVWIDTDVTDYDVPAYVNSDDGAGADLGTLLANGVWYSFVLYDPATPVPIPLLSGNETLTFNAEGHGLGAADDFLIDIELYSEIEER